MRQLSVRFKDGLIKAGGVVVATGTGAAFGLAAAKDAPAPVKYVAAGVGAVLGFGIAMGGPKFSGYVAALAFGLGLGGVLLFTNPKTPDNPQGGDTAIVQPTDPDETKNDVINHYHYYYNTYTCDENCPCRTEDDGKKEDDKKEDDKKEDDKKEDDKKEDDKKEEKPGIDIEQITPGTESTATENEIVEKEIVEKEIVEEEIVEDKNATSGEQKLPGIDINEPKIPYEMGR